MLEVARCTRVPLAQRKGSGGKACCSPSEFSQAHAAVWKAGDQTGQNRSDQKTMLATPPSFLRFAGGFDFDHQQWRRPRVGCLASSMGVACTKKQGRAPPEVWQVARLLARRDGSLAAPEVVPYPSIGAAACRCSALVVLLRRGREDLYAKRSVCSTPAKERRAVCSGPPKRCTNPSAMPSQCVHSLATAIDCLASESADC